MDQFSGVGHSANSSSAAPWCLVSVPRPTRGARRLGRYRVPTDRGCVRSLGSAGVAGPYGEVHDAGGLAEAVPVVDGAGAVALYEPPVFLRGPPHPEFILRRGTASGVRHDGNESAAHRYPRAVSYTHLTLPTIYSV